MKRFILFFTLIITLINTQLLSYGEMKYRNGNYIYGSDGSQYWQNGNYIYGSDGSQYWQNGNYIYGSDGLQYWQSKNYINKYNNNLDDDKTKSSSRKIKSPSEKYKIFNHNVTCVDGHLIMDIEDIKDSYKESSYTNGDGKKCTRIEKHKVIQKNNEYEIHSNVCIKYGFTKSTFKTITTLVPLQDNKFKISQYAHKGLFGKFVTYTDK